MTKEVFDQEFKGEFTALAGRVYSDFSRQSHVGNFPYNPMLPVFLGVDFGYRMPAVIFFQTGKIGDKGDDHIFIIDEILHEKNLKISELCAAIKKKIIGYPEYLEIQQGIRCSHL